MTATIEERLAAYREVLEEAIEARSSVGRPAPSGRRWRLLAPLLGTVAATTICLVVVIRDDDGDVAPEPADSAVVIAARPVSTRELAPAPASTAVAPTAGPATSATSAADPPIPTLAIGDSVMLGAAAQLTAAGVVVDTDVSRQLANVAPVVQQLAASDKLGNAVVVHLGNNGLINDADLQQFFTALAAVPKVIVLTVNVPREYAETNNTKLAALPASFPNVTVIPWDTLAPTCPGDCFYDDAIHLRPDGRTYYAKLILQALQTPAPESTTTNHPPATVGD